MESSSTAQIPPPNDLCFLKELNSLVVVSSHHLQILRDGIQQHEELSACEILAMDALDDVVVYANNDKLLSVLQLIDGEWVLKKSWFVWKIKADFKVCGEENGFDGGGVW